MSSLGIFVHNRWHLVDELDDVFSIDIAWGSFTSKHDCPRHYILTILRSHILYPKITVDDIENVHELPFVFMDPFNLDVEEGVLIYS